MAIIFKLKLIHNKRDIFARLFIVAKKYTTYSNFINVNHFRNLLIKAVFKRELKMFHLEGISKIYIFFT